MKFEFEWQPVLQVFIHYRPDKPHYDKMHERLQTDYAKKMKKLRQSTVEPVLGTLSIS